jgi:hypothetical protein
LFRQPSRELAPTQQVVGQTVARKPIQPQAVEKRREKVTQVEVSGTQNGDSSIPFIGGQVNKHVDTWSRLTSDHWIFDTVQGYNIDFVNFNTDTDYFAKAYLVLNVCYVTILSVLH